MVLPGARLLLLKETEQLEETSQWPYSPRGDIGKKGEGGKEVYYGICASREYIRAFS